MNAQKKLDALEKFLSGRNHEGCCEACDTRNAERGGIYYLFFESDLWERL